jgi:peptide/nickel transport system substrate-binding protein
MRQPKGDRSRPVQRRALMLGSAASIMLPTWRARAQTASVLNIATSGDPGPLDPTPVTSDLLSEITQLFYETLYIFGPDYAIAPLLAASLPEISDGGKRYVIKLRSGVPFHDGSTMNADDVVASLQRWGRLSPRGRTPWAFLDTIAAKDPATVEIVLKQPYSPLLNLLAFPNGSPQIMPKRIATAPDPLKDFTGTGPFKLIEYKPDTWVRVGKFAQYVSPSGTPSGYVGKREALVDEIRFLPSPNPTTRADGLLAGQYHWADNLTPESYARIHGKPDVEPGVLTAALWVLFIMNNKKGAMSNPLLRHAAQAAINCTDALGAAFGDKALWTLQGSIYPQGTAWFDADAPGYNQGNPEKAAALLKQAGYNREPIRVLTSVQYDYQYKTAQVIEANLTDAGFKIELVVTDWATILQRRQNPDQWEAFVTGHGVVPEPSSITVFNPSYPGWWDTPDKHAMLDAFTTESDPAKRVPLWHKLQAQFYIDVPTVKIGAGYTTFGASKRMSGYYPGIWPAFWNTKLSG